MLSSFQDPVLVPGCHPYPQPLPGSHLCSNAHWGALCDHTCKYPGGTWFWGHRHGHCSAQTGLGRYSAPAGALRYIGNPEQERSQPPAWQHTAVEHQDCHMGPSSPGWLRFSQLLCSPEPGPALSPSLQALPWQSGLWPSHSSVSRTCGTGRTDMRDTVGPGLRTPRFWHRPLSLSLKEQWPSCSVCLPASPPSPCLWVKAFHWHRNKDVPPLFLLPPGPLSPEPGCPAKELAQAGHTYPIPAPLPRASTL